MNHIAKKGPKRIICLTEETVEMLYLLEESDRIVGVSHYAVRPSEVKEKDVVSVFTHANIPKVIERRPDLVIGFSDIQKDISKELIGNGIQVLVTNQRSIDEILDNLEWLSMLVDQREKGLEIVKSFREKILEIQNKVKEDHELPVPEVYIEEWDSPQITAIKWFSELVEICGAKALFKNKSDGKLAKERFVTDDEIKAINPDMILGCWCGKPVEFSSLKTRLAHSKAVKSDSIYELIPEIFLQPGPALFVDGLDQLYNLIKQWKLKHK